MFKLECKNCTAQDFTIEYDGYHRVIVQCNDCGEETDITFSLAQLATRASE